MGDQNLFWTTDPFKVIGFLLLFYCASLLVMFMMQRDFIYITKTPRYPLTKFSYTEQIREVSVNPERDLRIKGWFVPPADKEKPVIVFFHGNASNLSMAMSSAEAYIEKGYGYLVAEYRGYSGNKGDPSEENLYQDGRAWIDYMKELGYEEGRLILFGESLGSGIAVQMATEYQGLKALVLISPYTRLDDVAKKHYPLYPVRLLMRDKYINIEKISKINKPVFIIHGGRDTIVPVSMAHSLYEKIEGEKAIKILPQSGHNELFLYYADIHILEFLQSLDK